MSYLAACPKGACCLVPAFLPEFYCEASYYCGQLDMLYLIHQTVNQSINQSIIHPSIQPINQSFTHSFIQSFIHSRSQYLIAGVQMGHGQLHEALHL